MSLDRIIASALWMGQFLAEVAQGDQQRDDRPVREDSPVGTLQSLLLERMNTAADSDIALYKNETGPYTVERFHRTFRDRKRHLEVPLTVHFPRGLEAGQRCPVVVFSPGLGAHPQATRFLEKHLASHGYLVLQPSHLGSDWGAVFTRTPLGAFTQRELLNRVNDIRLTLSLLEDGRLPSHLLARAEPERMALVGHSFGAMTAQAIAGVPVHDNEGRPLELADSRFQAFIGMSPFGDCFPTRRLGFDLSNYGKITRPCLFMSGDKDDLFTLGKGAQTHLGPFQKVASAIRYHVLIGNTRHADFSEILGVVRKQTSQVVNSTSTAFLDAYLKENSEARDYLENGLQSAVRRYQSWALTPADRKT